MGLDFPFEKNMTSERTQRVGEAVEFASKLKVSVFWSLMPCIMGDVTQM